jgi:penicillin V acylase-like amidase (Ntn superfamily)
MNRYSYMLLLAPLIFLQEVSACTIFTATKGKTVLFAGNEDQFPNESYLVVDPTGKYGVVFFATSTAEWPLVMQMGINEMGLTYDLNSISKETLVYVPDTIEQKEWALVQLMREVDSVSEMLDKFFTYNWGNSISYQIHVADRFGDAAVIHPGENGKLTYTRIDKNKGYIISTNFNLRDDGLKKYLSLRHRTAEKMLKEISTRDELTPELMADVLKATHQKSGWIDPTKTIYSAVFNLNTMDIHLYYDGKFNTPYFLNVKSELSKAPERTISPLSEVIVSISKNN